MISRRTVLAAGAMGAAGGAVPVAATGATLAEPTAAALPDLSFLRSTPVANAERVRWHMRHEGLEALIVCKPANVFYLTNHWPQLDRMGFEGAGIAIFSADPARPISLVMHAFLYYYTHTPESDFTDRAVFTYTQPTGSASTAGAPPPAAPARTMRVADEAHLTALDHHRASAFGSTRPPSADASWALAAALTELGLSAARVGIDDPVLEEALRSRGFTGESRGCENLIRRARLSKSPTEITLMRMAAQNNVDAAMAAALGARQAATTRDLRAMFFAEAAKRGNQGHFMVIGGVSSEALSQPLSDGMSLSIDCVSTLRLYHGDFGRTIFIGEPRQAVQRAAAAVATAWQDIREQLRPGMRFADIPRIGRESLARQGADLSVSFTPHSVGLFHTDHPQPSLISPRVAEELTLEDNMVLSVDCPVFVAGLGGTVHLEDLMLIREGRAEPIHTVPDPIIIV